MTIAELALLNFTFCKGFYGCLVFSTVALNQAGPELEPACSIISFMGSLSLFQLPETVQSHAGKG